MATIFCTYIMNTRLYVFCLALGQIFFSQSFGQQEDQNCLYIGTYNDTKEVLEKARIKRAALIGYLSKVLRIYSINKSFI